MSFSSSWRCTSKGLHAAAYATTASRSKSSLAQNLSSGALCASWRNYQHIERPHSRLMREVIDVQNARWHREARTKLSRRPWRVDTFDALAAKWFDASSPDSLNEASAVPRSPFRRVIMFVDNAGKSSTHAALVICAETFHGSSHYHLPGASHCNACVSMHHQGSRRVYLCARGSHCLLCNAV